MNTADVTSIKVALLSGGWSDEREISVTSGRACEKALHEAGFENVDFIEVDKEDVCHRLESGDYDVAFIAMHGPYGEDGCIQGLLEVLDIPYTFSGVLASAMATEKDIAKVVYERAGIPAAPGIVVRRDEVDLLDYRAVVNQLGFPLFVKPACDGSSFGVTRVTEAVKLREAIDLALDHDDRCLVEAAVTGTEITVPVIGNNDPQALPIIEIVTGADFYDLKVKYEPSELHHVCPARLPRASYEIAQEYAVLAHRILGCEGASRSDFIVQEDGTPVILETNTIPGMTPNSLLPDSARRAGIEFPELCRRFIEMALEAHPKRKA